MLRALRIHNMILIESVEISLGPGFNVISGETGAGKSAIMAALAMATGARSDAGLIRQHCDKASVEAIFDSNDVAKIADLLAAAEAEGPQDEPLVIRREIAASGRSRAFINDQLISLSVLKAIGERLIEMVGQHANQELRQLDSHRTLVDTFGCLTDDATAFASAWRHENQLKSERDLLIQQESQRLREIETCQLQLEELQEAQLKDGEEETLFAEYTLMNNAEELVQGIEHLCQAVGDGEGSALILLNRERNTLQNLVKLDGNLNEVAEGFERARIELLEVSESLSRYLARIESRPERLAQVNERLSLINRLKRKYGPSVADVCTFHATLEERLEQLQGADARLEQLEEQLAAAEATSQKRALHLTEKRKIAAAALSQALVKQLTSLNMPKVQLHIHVASQKRSTTGDDQVELFFAPNVGERLLSVKDCASGGELSRVMLGLKAVLANKAAVGTLVFDEVDANIGGETALIVGQKLAEIGQSMQLLCISHFPQVARSAQHHLQIFKEELQGRTYTRVKALDAHDRERELRRMMGRIDEITSVELQAAT